MDTNAIMGLVAFIVFVGSMFHVMTCAIVRGIVYFSRSSTSVIKGNLSFSEIDFPYFYTPATLYKHSNMNWFGCVVVYILLLPFGFIFELGGIIGWLFTYGRKA